MLLFQVSWGTDKKTWSWCWSLAPLCKAFALPGCRNEQHKRPTLNSNIYIIIYNHPKGHLLLPWDWHPLEVAKFYTVKVKALANAFSINAVPPIRPIAKQNPSSTKPAYPWYLCVEHCKGNDYFWNDKRKSPEFVWIVHLQHIIGWLRYQTYMIKSRWFR